MKQPLCRVGAIIVIWSCPVDDRNGVAADCCDVSLGPRGADRIARGVHGRKLLGILATDERRLFVSLKDCRRALVARRVITAATIEVNPPIQLDEDILGGTIRTHGKTDIRWRADAGHVVRVCEIGRIVIGYPVGIEAGVPIRTIFAFV